MIKDKKQKLLRKGWTLGSAADFLELSPEEKTYLDIKLALSKALREKRTGQNRNQSQLASLIQSSQSRVAKMESGDPSVSIDLLVKSLIAVGVSSKELAKTISSSK